MDEKTTLSDLLLLNLHNFEDEVLGIVDKAVKEMSMEKVLKELDVTWATMEFEHDHHPRRDITMLKASEELIEILEDNQVCWRDVLSSHFRFRTIYDDDMANLKTLVVQMYFIFLQ